MDPEVENSLAHLESQIAKLFSFWIKEKVFVPPPIDSTAFSILKKFILIQSNRTPKAGQEIINSLNDVFKKLTETHPEFSEYKDLTIDHQNPTLVSLISAYEYIHLLDYLEFKFLINLTEVPFISSDSPVTFYNQLLEKANNYYGATAIAAKGLQIFLPIHPRLCICLYDPIVYNFGNDCVNACSTEIWQEVHQINALQYLNSHTQVYFNEEVSNEYIEYLRDQYHSKRVVNPNINEIINADHRQLLLNTRRNPTIELNLEFFKIIVDPRNYRDQICPIRHESFIKP